MKTTTLLLNEIKIATFKKFVLAILLFTSFIVNCYPSNAQTNFEIQYVGSNDVCFSCVTLEVINPQWGYTYEWIRMDYSCQPMGNSTVVGTGSQHQACITGEYLCGSISPTGVTELSQPLRVRTLGSYLLPLPYSTNSVSCSSGITLCIPWIFLTPFTSNTVITWYKNNVAINGATANYVNVTSTGYYKYSITTGCITALSDSVHLATFPKAAITASGPTTFCSGGSVMLNAPTGINYTYQWKKGGVNIPGATSATYLATTAGNYKVSVTNTLTGCSKTTGAATVVTVNAAPAATVTPQGPTTFCAGGSVVLQANTGAGLSYKWKKNGVNIGGAVNSTYLATVAGNYKTVVTNTFGCSKISNTVTVTVPCREDGSAFESNGYALYPNPANENAYLDFNLNSYTQVTVTIYDLTGRAVSEIARQDFDAGNYQLILNTAQLNNGIYFVKVNTGSEKQTLKLTVQH